MKEADSGRSLTSPAAYLADLLQLLEDRFTGSDFAERRSDIARALLLNGEQSFSLVRQLDIVNRILADRISALTKAPADEVLASAVHPFALPFELEHTRIRQLLLLLRTPYRDLYSAFAKQPDVAVLARERLGLSPARAAALVLDLSADPAALAAAYGLDAGETLESLLPLERLRRATQLDGPSLRALLFSQLSPQPTASGGSERDAAGQLFLNRGLGGFVSLDAAEQRLIWNGEGAIPAAWFDRAHRLLCLARWTGLELSSLDLVLRQLCDSTLDAQALRRLAVLVDLRERTGAEIPLLCALFSELDGSATLGAGDDPKQAASLFDQVFNAEAARLAKTYIPSGSDYVPSAYQNLPALVADADLLVDVRNNRELRTRIQTCLGISGRDLVSLITRFRERATARGRVSRLLNTDCRSLSILHRVVRLAELVELPVLEFLRLVDVLEKDTSLKVLNAFDVLDPEELAQLDLYELLEQGNISARSWLIQNVVAIAAWAAAAQLTPEDLQSAAIVPDPALPEQKLELLATSQALHEAFLGSSLSAESLSSAELSARASRVALSTFKEAKRGLVSPADTRLVTWDETAARAAAHAAVQALEVVTVDDLQTLGLGEELAAYLLSLLVRRGFLDQAGILRDEALPARPEQLVIERDVSAQFGQIFDFLADLRASATSEIEATGEGEDDSAAWGDEEVLAAQADESGEQDGFALESEDDAERDVDAGGEDEDAGLDSADVGPDEAFEESEDASLAAVELQLYPSDLLKLGFEPAEADELFERLYFLGVLDASGMVLDPDAFSDTSMREQFASSRGLDTFRNEIHALLTARCARFRSAALRLPDSIWDELPLTLAEREALEQNLVFNGHIDAARSIVDRKVLSALTPDTFDLTLPLYRHRRAILSALKEVVRAAREEYLTVGVDELRELADRCVAVQAQQALAAAGVLDERGRLTAAVLPEIASEVAPFDLAGSYSEPQLGQIWDLLRQVAEESGAFRLTEAALATVDLVGEHAREALIALCATGSLQPDGSLTPEQVARFGVIHAAQDFTLPGYTDYARDVFFLVHDVAIAVASAVSALSGALSAVAKAQEQAVLEVLGARVELSPEAALAVLRPLLRDEAHPVAALLAPVLRALGSEEVLLEPPQDRAFCACLGRLRAFAGFARKLQMTPRQIEVAFQDQQLVDKFPEVLELPVGIDAIDALWTAPNGKLYLFRGAQYWVFDAKSLLVLESARPLSQLSPKFAELAAVDALYGLPNGEHWLLAEGRCFRRAPETEHWLEVPRAWGRVQSRFEDPEHIECALHDHEGRVHLFSGDQYVRYSSSSEASPAFVDEGYPRRIAGQWQQELGLGALPASFGDGIDAAVGRKYEGTWLFKGDSFIVSSQPGVEKPIVGTWGHVRNNLASAARVDAVVDFAGRCGIVVGDQISVFSHGLENEEVCPDAGYPRTLAAAFPGLPDAFAHGFDASLSDEDGTLHLFRDQTCASRREGWESAPTRERWGRVRNELQETGRVDAALAGLDGKVYLFSGNQYVRYSSADLSRVDEGYPRTISRDWGGLSRVETAFVLDGKTYLFGSDPYQSFFVRYSTRDYTIPDAGYPRPTDENWWNLPAALVEQHFNQPDAVFVAPDGRIHLFRGQDTIAFDHNHRWWSEPTPIQQAWSSLPLASVSAAFAGKDGRSYLFSSAGEPQFVRYTDATFQRLDDRFPKPVKEHWGKLANNLERTGRVDAATSLVSTVVETALDGTVSSRKVRYRYVFSGDQFYRYSGDQQTFLDEGYPLRILNNLRREPHFVNLDAPAERGIDALWADRGNVYVFISDKLYAASSAPVRELDGLGVELPRALDVEEGRLGARSSDGWRSISSPEAHSLRAEPALPHVLRDVPAPFQEATCAILRGTDRNVYLFGAGQCYDRDLERQYATGASWGHARNPIVEDERVDSALMGRDGKLYLFRGDKFVSYTPTSDAPTQLPELADATPQPIAARWGGLSNVRHAFVQKGITYLLEAPGADGSFRYVRYFGVDYGQPNEPAPLRADFSFWKIPTEYVSRGFDRVDAVMTEGDDLFLLREGQFLHYEAATGVWNFPRPLSLFWPGLNLRQPEINGVRACVRALDKQTYFFGAGVWLAHDDRAPSAWSPISARWGRLKSRITLANRVDATLVLGAQTFLFSGDEYVRYSGTDYQYVDAGYPRPIAGWLRQEAPFQLLPADVEIAFQGLKPDDVWVEAAFATGRLVCIRLAGRSFALSATLSRSYPLSQVARVRNELLRRARVDAAFATPEGAILLLSGDQYVRYSGVDLDAVDDGYPQAIADGLLRELKLDQQLPLSFHYGLDASLCDARGGLVLFKGKQFVSVDPAAGQQALVPQPIKGVWGRTNNVFLPSASEPRSRLDAAFVAPDQALYVFKGGQYLRYASPSAELADEGYPRAIRDQWGDLPSEFEAGIDGAFFFGGRTYLCREQRYVRYQDAQFRFMDASYPQRFGSRWRASNDFLLRDLRCLERYTLLDQRHPSEAGSLTDFLLSRPREKVDPYALLANLFDWDVRDLQWLKRRDAYLERPQREVLGEVRFDLEQVLRIHGSMELARRLGASAREVYELVWTPLYADSSRPGSAADALERMLRTLHPGDTGKLIERQLGDALSLVLRDAQVAWLLAHSPEQFSDARELSNWVLSDVEIDASVEGSPVTEAIGAVQLYFHRYLSNLEPVAADGDDVVRRARFKEQWTWLKNYRVWEANRKVFLFPESYIRPELRDTRTTAFKTLQDNLHQSEITEASVTQAYKKYLDEYTEVSRLIIAGGYVQPDPRNEGDAELTLFGTTRTAPRRYYYRTATFKDEASSSAIWRAWRPLGIDIAAEQVYPVRAFGRSFVFWTEVEQKPDSSKPLTLKTVTKGDTEEVRSEERVLYCLKISYSFYDLSEQWVAPQILALGTLESAPITSPRLHVSCVQEGDDDAVIEVNFEYSVADPARVGRKVGARGLRADLTVSALAAKPVADRRADKLKTLFAPDRSLELDSVVVLGSGGRHVDAPWYSFDLKGGSFLARPLQESSPGQETSGRLTALRGNLEGLPSWERVDTCLDTSEGQRLLFDNQRMVYRDLTDATELATAERWGLRYTKVLAEERVDAAWKRRGVSFLSHADRYLKYSAGLVWADEPGDQGSAEERARDQLPPWSTLDAAFTDAAGNTHFFSGKKCVKLSATNSLGAELDIGAAWGIERNAFNASPPGTTLVVAAFTRAERCYLIGPTSYTWYASADMLLCERPKPQSLWALLDELRCSNNDDAFKKLRISEVVESGKELLFRVSGDDSEGYVLKDDKVTKAVPEPVKKTPPPRPFASFTHAGKLFVLDRGKGGVVAWRRADEPAERREAAQDISAAMRGLDGCVYLFSQDKYVRVAPEEPSVADAIDNWGTRSRPIAEQWGRVRNAFTSSGQVSAAFVRGAQTFVVSADAYVRYSGADYSFIDADYPRSFAGNPDGLPELPVDAALETEDGRVCYFIGADHTFGDALSKRIPNRTRWGRLRSNLLFRGPDAAYRVDGKHYLFSGNELACYTAGNDGKLPRYMDAAPLQTGFGTFAGVHGAFVHRGFLYLVGRDRFVCCAADKPEQPLAGYPRTGQALALIADVRARFGLAAAGDNLAEGQDVFALLLQNGALFLDTDDHRPGQRVLRLDLASGELSRQWESAGFGWAELRLDGNTYVDVAAGRYSFRDDRVLKSARGVAPSWGPGNASVSVASIWGGAPFDAAISVGDRVYLFDDGLYASLARQDATDAVGGATLVTNLRNALEHASPIRGSFTTFPAELSDGFDAALWTGDRLVLFKGPNFVRVSAAPKENAALKYELVRLTTSTAAYLNQALFAGGLTRLLSLRTQAVDETPGFSLESSGPTLIRVRPEQVHVTTLPRDGQLDFASANGIYLWEIFFHAPFLIAETLSTAQRFEEARGWYQHVFDPTEPADAWKFLPFLTVDVERLVVQIRDRLTRLERAKVDVSLLKRELELPSAQLLAMDAAFQGERDLTPDDVTNLDALTKLPALVAAPLKQLATRPEAELKALAGDLRELVDMVGALKARWDSMLASSNAQIDTYLDDPFDPHAIAAQRPIAYRKAVVMRYLDNLLEWGDMLFAQYTRESINEARMLYVRAWDLLGRRPESLGRRLLPADSCYAGLRDHDGEYDMLLQLKASMGADAALSFAGSSASDAQTQPYFFLPVNEELSQYWSRVADRLHKIRHSLNLQGLKQPLALFEPPLDPMALVRAVAGSAGLAGAIDSAAPVEIPHYRFSFLAGKAQALAQKVAQLGADLLGALEKRDAEALSQLQTRQEGVILTLTRELRRSQLQEAKANLVSLRAAHENAQKRRDVYTQWLDAGMTELERAQLGLMIAAAVCNGVAAGIHLGSALAALNPKTHYGIFIFGFDSPEWDEVLSHGAEGVQSLGEGLQVGGEIAGILAQQERSANDWGLQRDLAKIDLKQIEAQINGAEWQIKGAEQEIALAERQIEHNESVARFYRAKFTNQELYEWMAGQLSAMHYQSYQLALGMARAAERAFQFERGSSQASTSFIQGQHWDGQRKGLLTGASLGLDLDRMEAAFIARDARRFEISKTVSLLELDPMAFLKLKAEGACEFELSEALFDYDFPGHYCRQVKTLSLDLALGEGVLVNGTLTQLTNRVVMEADSKAVAFLLDPKETPPSSLRSNWKAMQQIALSEHDENEPNNGIFELRFDSERYLPFEGTGAVSRWRLELSGRPGSYDLRNLSNVTLKLKYTALQGGDAFAAAVRGLLKPTDALRAFNLSTDLGEAWQTFLQDDSDALELFLRPEFFPGMVSGRIRAIFSRYETETPGAASFVIDMGQQLPLPDGKTVDTSGLSVRPAGTTLRLKLKGDKTQLTNAYLVFSYKAGAS
jgi:hypothetical protein